MLPTLSALPSWSAAWSDCVTVTWRTTVVPLPELNSAYAPAPTARARQRGDAAITAIFRTGSHVLQ